MRSCLFQGFGSRRATYAGLSKESTTVWKYCGRFVHMTKATQHAAERFIESQHGVVKTAEFKLAGLHASYLGELVQAGVLVRLKGGLYLASQEQTPSGFHETQLALPRAIVCLASALAHYDLSTYQPPVVHVALPRDDRTRAPDFPPVRTFSFGPARFGLGVVNQDIDGHPVAIYDREKTLCDSIRYRSVLGQDLVNEAVRTYLSSSGTNIDLVLDYARLLGSEGPVTNHLRLAS